MKSPLSSLTPNLFSHDSLWAGTVDYHELEVCMKALGFEDTTRNEVEELVRDYDVQDTGRIKRDDFEKIMREKFAQRDPTEEIVKAFKLFDEVSGTTDDMEHLLSFVLGCAQK